MSDILVGYRLVFRAYGMNLDGDKPFSGGIGPKPENPNKFPFAIIHFGSAPFGSPVLEAPFPSFIVRGPDPTNIQVHQVTGEREGGGPPAFTDIIVRRTISVPSDLGGRWEEDPAKTSDELDRAYGQQVMHDLRPYAELLAAAIATYVADGAILERITEGPVYYVGRDNLRFVAASNAAEFIDTWRFDFLEFKGVLEKSLRLVMTVPERLPAAALASHWYLLARPEKSAVDRFLRYFLILEVLSWFALELFEPQARPWEQRANDIGLLERETHLSKTQSVLPRVVQRLKETRYAAPSLTEAFDHFADSVPTHFSGRAKQQFRSLRTVRNDLLHGRVSDLPPTIMDKQSTLLTVEALAKSALRAALEKLIELNAEREIRFEEQGTGKHKHGEANI